MRFPDYMSRRTTKQTTWRGPSEDSDQPRLPPSLIRVFPVRMKKAWVLSYPLSAQRRLWSVWVDAQADLSLLWAHSHFVGFVMRRLISFYAKQVRHLQCLSQYSSPEARARKLFKFSELLFTSTKTHELRKIKLCQDLMCLCQSVRLTLLRTVVWA